MDEMKAEEPGTKICSIKMLRATVPKTEPPVKEVLDN